MAVLFATGFEHGAITYAQRMGLYFASVGAYSVESTPGFYHQMGGRGGVYSLLATAQTVNTPVVPSSARWVHFWFRTLTNPISASFSITFIAGNGVNQWSATFRTDGFIELRRGGVGTTLVATSAASINYANGHWVAIELLALDAGGTSTVYVDEVSFVSFTGDTKATTVDNWQIAQFHNSNEDIYYDDIIITDNTTGRLAEVTGVGFKPNSNVSAGWSPSSGTNYQAVSVVPVPDTPTVYIAATAAATEDIYGLTYPQGASSIAFVAAHSQSRRQGSLAVQTGLRSGATTSYGTGMPGAGGGADALAVNSLYLEDNPDTAAPWDPGDLADLQVALKTV